MATAPSRMPLRVIRDRANRFRLPLDVRFPPKTTGAVSCSEKTQVPEAAVASNLCRTLF